jgi:hypothetical protein
LFVHGVAGGLMLLVVAGILGALTRAAWPHLPERGRPARLLVVAVVAAVALGKLIGFG